MNHYWSTYMQKTEELYASRALKFTAENMDRWLSAMRLRDGMKLLEVGCAGGLLCHRIKAALPGSDVTGLDFDLGHIEYARRKSAELGLACDFVAGDACALPFAENSFDACFSHTVMVFCEPTAFVREQYRVLKPGGRMMILCVVNAPSGPEAWVPTEGDADKPLFDRVWAAALLNPNSEPERYEGRPERYFAHLHEAGFRDLSADAVAAVTYAPGCANVSRETALAQINEDRLSALCSAEKAYILAPDALSDAEYALLRAQINARFDERIAEYARGGKDWAFRVATVLIISGTK